MKKIVITILFIGVLVLGLTGILYAQENIIKIGAAVSLTGKIAYEGRLVKNGFEVWEDWVNSHGGITAGGKNYQVKIIYYDDESTPVRGAKLTEMLITQNKVNFLFGPFSSSITLATTAIGEKYKVITIAPLANASDIYERGYKYVFSVLPPSTTATWPIAHMALDFDPKPEKVAIIAANDLWALSDAEGFRDEAIRQGYEIVLFEKYPANAMDISALLTQVKALNPDILLSFGYTNDTAMFIKQCKELDVNPKMSVSGCGLVIPSFVEEMGGDLEYVYEIEWWMPSMLGSDKIFGTTTDYVQACQDKFGPDFIPNYYVSAASTAGSLLQLAIEKADSIETEKVREALSSLDVELATWFAVAFNEKGQNIKWLHPVVQMQNNIPVVVYPESAREKSPIYPTPAWKDR